MIEVKSREAILNCQLTLFKFRSSLNYNKYGLQDGIILALIYIAGCFDHYLAINIYIFILPAPVEI